MDGWRGAKSRRCEAYHHFYLICRLKREAGSGTKQEERGKTREQREKEENTGQCLIFLFIIILLQLKCN